MKSCPTGKITTTLVTFLAGFAAAIYGLAPVDRVESDKNNPQSQQAVFASFTKSDQFALQCGSVLKKWANIAEDAVVQAGSYLRDKQAAKEISSSENTVAKCEPSDSNACRQ